VVTSKRRPVSLVIPRHERIGCPPSNAEVLVGTEETEEAKALLGPLQVVIQGRRRSLFRRGPERA
jgi:hypothetical protein